MAVKPNIRAGNLVKIHQSPDSREINSFRSHLAKIGMNDEVFVRSVGKYDVSIIKHGKFQAQIDQP